MLLHQTHNCSKGQLSHPGWGSRSVSGCAGTNAGNWLLEHDREAAPRCWGMDQCYPVTMTDCSHPFPYPPLSFPPFLSFSLRFLVLPSACVSGGRNQGEGEEKENSLNPGPRTKKEEAQVFSLGLCFWTPEKPASHRSTVFIPAKIQPLNNITISTQLHQQKLPSDVFSHSYSHPSVPKPNEITTIYYKV